MNLFSKDHPVFLGFCGPAGSGKTSTANKLVPPVKVQFTSDSDKEDPIVWDHITFAGPLYEMANSRLKIEGVDTQDRILYALHDTLSEVINRNAPFDDFIELIYDMYHLPCNIEGTKARSFMQQGGDLCRALYEDCFADYAKNKVYKNYRNFVSELHPDAERPWYVTVVSDLRMLNEADVLRAQPNCILIKFEADEAVRKNRLLERDGTLLTEGQSHHKSETELESIPSEMFDLILDTSEMTLNEQALSVLDFLRTQLTISTLEDQLSNAKN